VAIKHYLITRFNLRVPEWRDTDRKGNPTLTPEWMAHRWGLFQRYTVPSVLAQKHQDFEWLVLFDMWTPLPDQEIYTPLLLTRHWLKELQKYLRTHCTSDWVLTTRLDNDDAISTGFMQVIREAATEKEEFLNIPNGWIQRGRHLTPEHHTANPFVSLVEPAATAKSVYFTPHGKAMSQHAPVRQITKERLWTQIIHERNYLNA